MGRSRGARRAAGEQERVGVALDVRDGHVDADVGAGDEADALGLHLGEPAVEHPLLHLELGDAVAEQPADPVVALEDGHGVAGAVQLLGGGEAGRAGADDGDRLPVRDDRRLGPDPALREGAVDDRRARWA